MFPGFHIILLSRPKENIYILSFLTLIAVILLKTDFWMRIHSFLIYKNTLPSINAKVSIININKERGK